MKKIGFISAVIAAAMAFSSSVLAKSAIDMPKEQVWEAQRTNNQMTCGIDFSNGSPLRGQILAKGENANSAGAVKFEYKTNAQNISWKVIEAKVTDQADKFTFSEKFTSTDRNVTSLFAQANGQGFRELAWVDAQTPQVLQQKIGFIELQPKININGEEFPLGTTLIQGKIVVTCSN